MNIVEEVLRLDPVMLHQPGERSAVIAEIALLYPPRLDRVAAEQAPDIGPHPLVDQIEQPG